MTADGSALRWVRRAAMRMAESCRALARRRHGPTANGFGIGPAKLAIGTSVALLILFIVAVTFDAAAVSAAGRAPVWLVKLFNEATDFGKSGWFLWPLAAMMIGLAVVPSMLSRPSQWVLAAVAVRAQYLFAAIALPGLFATVIKRLIGRARPGVGGSASVMVFEPFAWRVEYASLPSGHATTAVAAAVAISSLWPRTRTVMWIYAGVIMVSRVIIQAHFPTDVLAGAVVGAGGAIVVRHYFARAGRAFAIAPDGTLVQFPGPSLRRIKAVARDVLAE